MNLQKVRIVTMLAGFIVGGLSGAFLAITKGTPFVFSIIGGIIVGMLLIGFGVFNVVASDTVQSQGIRLRNKILLAIASLAIAAAAASIVAISYTKTTPGHTEAREIFMALLGGIPSAILIWRSIGRHLKHRAKSRQKQVQIDEANNFMGKQRIEYFYYILADNEMSIRFAERPPPIQGILMIGVCVIPLIFACWGYSRFIGYRRMYTAIANGSLTTIGVILIVIAIALTWFIASLRELPLQNPQEELNEDERKKNHKQSGQITVLVIIGLAGASLLLRFPYWHWIKDEASTSPTHLWLIAIVPLTVWTILRWFDYWMSATILSNIALHKGSTGLILPSAGLSVMNRSKLTTYALRQGFLREIAGYFVLKTDSQGQEDREFHGTRVRHGDELSVLLADNS